MWLQLNQVPRKFLLKLRLCLIADEIKAMDKSSLASSEKKELRKEDEIKSQLGLVEMVFTFLLVL
jgi:hypothetical protein